MGALQVTGNAKFGKMCDEKGPSRLPSTVFARAAEEKVAEFWSIR
jgi:hypothetical protein